MNQPNDREKFKFSQWNDRTRKIVMTMLYWIAACAVLVSLIVLVLYATSPSKSPRETPDITATLEAALVEALGPPPNTATSTQTPTITQTPTPSWTPLPTLTSTITPTPTITPTSTNTPQPPTLTPALPYNVNEAFQIVPLSPARYDYAIALLESLPDLLPDGTDNPDYYPSFYPAILLQSEALLRYPTDPRVASWRWGLAYNLARIGDDRAILQYASLLSQQVNAVQSSLEELPDWVESQDPRISLKITRINPVQENLSNHLVELDTPGGSLFLWLVEVSGKKTIYTLSDETDFSNPQASQITWADLNGDTTVELVIFTPGPGIRNLKTPTVFDLTKNPPKQLLFNPDQNFEIGLENETTWKVVGNDQDFSDLQLNATVYPPCPATVMHTYHWGGRWLERVSEDYQVETVSQLLSSCELLVDQASSVWSLPAAIQIMEDLLPDWPPESTSQKIYPLDAYDEWRYRLGVYHALVGDLTAAATYFEGIIQSPVIPISRWITPAQDFLKTYDTPAGLYKACVNSEFCDPRIALQNWVATLTPEEAKNAVFTLGYAGVSFRYTDVFDFEGDGIPERWFTIRHRPTERLEFWILSETDTGMEALFVDTVDVNKPTLTRYTNLKGQTYVWIGSQQSFRLVRYPDTLQASIELLPPSYYNQDLTNQIAQNSLEALTSGFSPDLVYKELLDHYESTAFLCLTKEDCGRFNYALGLAAELSGREVPGVDAYLRVWWDAYESLYTTIVRLKLAYKPGYGPLPTPTITPTYSNTPIPTRTNTPVYSPTPTRTGSVSPTVTSTPTATHTENPDMTYTPTPTASHTPTATSTSNSYP
jgi:hypothetical protein